ncbi:thiamine pyrophosphate-binding protein [Rhodobacteraceae bacterium D3-12]|nr:thiamine pyrophosphate-binding protein [Rhodobacteraceae bacterium D3-12]
MPDQIEYMHQSIAQAVRDHDIDTMFGLVGDANLFMANHFVSGCGGTLVPAAHEGGTVLMAQAYGQVTGKTGVATVTQGPRPDQLLHRAARRRGCPPPYGPFVRRHARHGPVSPAKH